VVYDNLPSAHGERHTLWEETLACPRKNTMLVMAEPAIIKVYGTGFLNQFGWVLTSNEPWIFQHPDIIRSQTGMGWFYAGTYDEIVAHPPEQKTGPFPLSAPPNSRPTPCTNIATNSRNG
jgi:hypothetical protein